MFGCNKLFATGGRKMNISLALLADCANISQEGKLNILGIFDRVNAKKLPVVHPQMQLVITIEADRAEAEREHKIEIQLIDSDGARLVGIEGNMRFAAPPPGERIKINHTSQLNNLKFDRFGAYEFKILINNEVRKSVPLTVAEVKEP
jgi:hypothetical protein